MLAQKCGMPVGADEKTTCENGWTLAASARLLCHSINVQHCNVCIVSSWWQAFNQQHAVQLTAGLMPRFSRVLQIQARRAVAARRRAAAAAEPAARTTTAAAVRRPRQWQKVVWKRQAAAARAAVELRACLPPHALPCWRGALQSGVGQDRRLCLVSLKLRHPTMLAT
jgi:hypothetical protein